MKKLILGALLISTIILSKAEIQGQEFTPKQKICQPSARAVLSVVQAAYNLSPGPEEVVIAGEVRAPNWLPAAQRPFSLTQALAILGGALQTAKEIYVIRQSAEAAEILKIDLKDIKEGRAQDLSLEKGDAVFVSRGCADGKLLPPRKTGSPFFHRGTDNPFKGSGSLKATKSK